MSSFANRQKPTQEVISSNATKAMAASTKGPGGHSFLRLQRTIGNRAVQGLLQRKTRNVDAPSAKNIPAGFGHRLTGGETASLKRDVSKGRKGMPQPLKTRLETLSGIDLSHIRVHRNSGKPARVNALAYTQGRDIHLGPGQDEHLPHEGWHAVQQMQGRVKPTSVLTKGASISNEPVLEREADQMGEKASRAFSESAPKNSQLPVSQSVQRNVMQRKKVPMDFGDFETTKFKEANDKGVEITLEFKPDKAKVDAKKIALAQSVKAIKEGGAAYATTPNMANRMVGSGKPGEGFTIDAPANTNNPIYFDTKNLGATEDLKDTPMSGNNPANPVVLGSNTNYILGYCYKEKQTDVDKKAQNAAMYDMPQGRKKNGAGMEFETTAFAIDGADAVKSTYYGSVKWGYKVGGTDAAPKVASTDITDISEASRGTPTAKFMEAAKLWNVGKTQGKLKVIADPAVVYKMDGATTETLAKGTTLKQLDTIAGGPEPMIKAEVLNTDGTGSAKFIFINVQDVKDMGDGSANKKLPMPADKPAARK